LLAPLWLGSRNRSAWLRWYSGVLASLAIGTAIGLAWALPAAGAGGEAYREAILWGQTAERLVDSFAHARPWWWYLPWLPLLTAPWLLLPWVWRGLLRRPQDAGTRLCLTWLVATLVLASAVSGKQVKYLLPLLPAVALLVAQAMLRMPGAQVRQRPWLPALLLLLAGGLLALLPARDGVAPWLADIHPAGGLLLMVPALLLLRLRDLTVTDYVRKLALLSVAAVSIVQLTVFPPAAPAYDLRETAAIIARAQAEGRPVANLGRYHGQFHYHGRLRERLTPVSREVAFGWVRANPDGDLVVYYDHQPPAQPAARHVQPYRGGALAIWPARTVAEAPEVLP
jgi:4-amino-4-deoxy-L-arabinose transferase-like glycosyltransferase